MQTADILRSVRERFDALPVPVKIGMAAGGSVLLIAVVIGLFAFGPAAPAPAATTTATAAATASPAAVVVPPAGVAVDTPDAILQPQRLRETWVVGTRTGLITDWAEVAAIERDARTFLFSAAPTGDLATMIQPGRDRFFMVEATGYFRVAAPGEHTVIVNHSAADGNAGMLVFLNDSTTPFAQSDDSTIPFAQSAVEGFGGYTRAADSLVTAVELTPGIHRLRVVARQDSVREAPMEVRVMMRAPGDPVPAPVVPGILNFQGVQHANR